MLSQILAALGIAPKTLPQATETLGQAKTTLDSVAALFTAAGLNLEQMLAAGPESLKAHLELIDNSDELATALQENELLTTQHEQLKKDFAGVAASNEQCEKIFTAMGLSATVAADAAPDAIKTAFDAHVSKQATLALAKTGHPPAHVPASDAPTTTPKTDADLAKEYQAMKAGPDRLAFYSQHEAALHRFAKSLSKPE